MKEGEVNSEGEVCMCVNTCTLLLPLGGEERSRGWAHCWL